jgi:SAM-dependent methyltransferase
MSSVHHWRDRARGVAEARRVLVPGGRLLLADRRVRPGARGLAGHGLTTEEVTGLLEDAAAAGFVDVTEESGGSGGMTFVVVRAAAPGTPADQSVLGREEH